MLNFDAFEPHHEKTCFCPIPTHLYNSISVHISSMLLHFSWSVCSRACSQRLFFSCDIWLLSFLLFTKFALSDALGSHLFYFIPCKIFVLSNSLKLLNQQYNLNEIKSDCFKILQSHKPQN